MGGTQGERDSLQTLKWQNVQPIPHRGGRGQSRSLGQLKIVSPKKLSAPGALLPVSCSILLSFCF